MTYDIVVKQHGGRIDVETESGSYTEFVVILPRDEGTSAGWKPYDRLWPIATYCALGRWSSPGVAYGPGDEGRKIDTRASSPEIATIVFHCRPGSWTDGAPGLEQREQRQVGFRIGARLWRIVWD
jgi:hypothetical protein